MSPSNRNQCIIDILIVAKKTLDTAQGPLSLVPVPGLSSAASVLSSLIDIILVAKVNKGTRQDIANHIDVLTKIIEQTRSMAMSVLETEGEISMQDRLVNSPELKKRVATLENDLKDLTNETKNLDKGLFGLLLSRKNADTLLRIKEGIDNATKRFQIQSGITVEMLINGIVDDIRQIKRKQQQEFDARALKDLPHVNAGYSSALNRTKSGTLKGTRTALLEEIAEWSLRSPTGDNSSFIYVLSGGAGTGKSTIAFEMAQRFEEDGVLGGSFFFVHDASDFNTTTHVLTTIAYQLACNHESLYPHIAKAAREYSRKGKQGEKLQMDLENLIIKPLKNVEASHRPIVLVFDALDECTKAAQDEVVRLLFLFMERLPEVRFPVRVLVTTRPEMKIEAALNTERLRQVSKPYRLHEIPRQVVDADIKLFLNVRLKDYSCWQTISNARPDVITGLTNLSAGLFIYAATVVKLLGDNPYRAVDILDALLSDNGSNASFTLKNLDGLYIFVLQNALNDDDFNIPGVKKDIQIVIGTLALLQDQVSTSCLNDLISVSIPHIRDILSRLGSVILKPENDNIEIRMLHASFPQFLIDDKRCTNSRFYIDPSVHHQRLALTCLEVMNARHPLKRNICGFDDPTIMKSDIPDFHDTVNKCIQPSLWYSCTHWATHLSKCKNPDQDILDAVVGFARKKLLMWVEVLSYMNRLEVAVPALLAALSWCEVHINSNEILQVIDDTYRLVLQCYVPINDCPEHLYISAFPLAPSSSFTTHYNNFVNKPTRSNAIIKPMMPRDLAWGACLHSISIDARDCRPALSPNGSLIASGLLNGTVGIWDASNGLSKRFLTGHTKSVQCVAWSPDGDSVASGSADGTVCVWNATSGAQVHVQCVQATECIVSVLAWGQDGTQLVTGTKAGEVHVWDIVIGKELKARTTIPDVGAVLAISKDLRAVDRTDTGLRLWNFGCDGGEILKELPLPPLPFYVLVAAFLHGGTQVVFSGSDSIYVWDLESGRCTAKVSLESTICGIAVSQNENTIALSTMDRIHFLNLKSWSLLGSFRGCFLYSASFSPDERRFVSSFNNIQLWDSPSVLAPKPRLTSSTLSPLSLSPSPIEIHTQIHFVAISLDGSRVAAVSGKAVSIWSLQSASLFCIIWEEVTGNTAFSPDAQKIALAEWERIRVWDITTTQPVSVWSISTANGISDTITWSPDGHWIAGAAFGPDNTRGLGVFNAATGDLAKYLAFNDKEAYEGLEFSNDITMLYVRTKQGDTLFRWKEGEIADSDQHKWEIELDRRRRFHKDAWIVSERDGKRLCWVQKRYQSCVARWGNYYVVGKVSGQLNILYIKESSVDVAES